MTAGWKPSRPPLVESCAAPRPPATAPETEAQRRARWRELDEARAARTNESQDAPATAHGGGADGTETSAAAAEGATAPGAAESAQETAATTSSAAEACAATPGDGRHEDSGKPAAGASPSIPAAGAPAAPKMTEAEARKKGGAFMAMLVRLQQHPEGLPSEALCPYVLEIAREVCGSIDGDEGQACALLVASRMMGTTQRQDLADLTGVPRAVVNRVHHALLAAGVWVDGRCDGGKGNGFWPRWDEVFARAEPPGAATLTIILLAGVATGVYALSWKDDEPHYQITEKGERRAEAMLRKTGGPR